VKEYLESEYTPALRQFRAAEAKLRHLEDYFQSVTREFQRQHPGPSTGKTIGACPGYWKDHIVPLACGGPDAVENMQWLTIADAKSKDSWERQACAR
jgi:hypothetical protein